MTAETITRYNNRVIKYFAALVSSSFGPACQRSRHPSRLQQAITSSPRIVIHSWSPLLLLARCLAPFLASFCPVGVGLMTDVNVIWSSQSCSSYHCISRPPKGKRNKTITRCIYSALQCAIIYIVKLELRELRRSLINLESNLVLFYGRIKNLWLED
jgi:hypothetical protein